MGAFGDIGARGLLFSARQPACATGLMGSWGLGCRGMTAWLVKSPQTGLTKTVVAPAEACLVERPTCRLVDGVGKWHPDQTLPGTPEGSGYPVRHSTGDSGCGSQPP
jgi:hypothetical protein